jgi:GMP synthase (glutamine-hydrolysing)
MSSDSALANLFSEAPSMFHLHGDTFDFPAGAQCLASSSQYANQAYGIENYALGFQFHPEVTADGLERWYVGHACELAAAKVDITALRKASRELAPKLEQAALRFWRSWLDQLHAVEFRR